MFVHDFLHNFSERAGHASDMMKTIDRQEWYAVVICSGDGLIYEVRLFVIVSFGK